MVAIVLRCTTGPSPSTTCRASSLRSVWNKVIATLTFLIGRDVEASRLQAATTDFLRSMLAPTGVRQASATATLSLRKQRAVPVKALELLPGSAPSGGLTCAPTRP